ncbi:hypothetical protein MHYP_G00201480 [Metynnis hypsauchen]
MIRQTKGSRSVSDKAGGGPSPTGPQSIAIEPPLRPKTRVANRCAASLGRPLTLSPDSSDVVTKTGGKKACQRIWRALIYGTQSAWQDLQHFDPPVNEDGKDKEALNFSSSSLIASADTAQPLGIKAKKEMETKSLSVTHFSPSPAFSLFFFSHAKSDRIIWGAKVR